VEVSIRPTDGILAIVGCITGCKDVSFSVVPWEFFNGTRFAEGEIDVRQRRPCVEVKVVVTSD
jgi:hypothetical protein